MNTSKSIWKLHLVALAFASLSCATFFYPTTQASLIEHILVDTHGAHSSGFAVAITPCTNYISGNQSMGRETAAQWLRVAFHDFVTARVSEGLGGIDASIGFETLREENSGSAFNDSFSFFRPYVSPKISMADLVALSVSMSVGNCGGPQIPFRGGRIDATSGGASGVPAPETSLEETLQYFENAGFNQVDSIGLTVCGHSVGSVHHGGFPTVVGPEAVSSSNIAGGIHFDSTVDVFDIDVVNEYLNGTGNQGGPLVTSFNVSSRSDLRLYESDNNATVIKYAQQGAGFLDSCSTLLRRMVETVPKEVVLSDVIQPQAIKPINASLDFDRTGNLVFSGYVRILSSTGSAAPTSLGLSTSCNSDLTTLTPEPALGTSVFGTTSFFPFQLPISNPSAFSTFTVSNHGGYAKTFPVQTEAFVIPSLTSITPSNTSTTVNFVIAVSTSQPSRFKKASLPSVKVVAPIAQMGTLGPAMRTINSVPVVSYGQKTGYSLWKGSVSVEDKITGPIMVAIVDGTGEEIDVAFP